MNSFRTYFSFLILAGMFLGISVADAQVVADLPGFKSGASIMLGVPVDFGILTQRVGAIYEIVENDDSHIIWKFTGTTGDWAFVFADGRILVASAVNLDLAMKDMLYKELNDILDILNSVNPGLIDSQTRYNALESAVYYANEEGIYHRLRHDFDGDFELTLLAPESTIKNARLTVSGIDGYRTGMDLGGSIRGPGNFGQKYSIDDIEAISCGSNSEMSCFVPSLDITDKLTPGLHKLNSYRIDQGHTMTIEAITATKPLKGFIMYGPSYIPWINETSESMGLDSLYTIIGANASEVESKETIQGEIIGKDLTNLPNVKLNVFLNITDISNLTFGPKDFTVDENNESVPIDTVYFTGDATGKQLDLAVVFDNTTSMDDRIKALKSKVKDLTQKINSSNLSARYSLVTFNGASTNTEINWTDDAESYQKAVGRLSVSGGNIDLPENSLEGIERALSFGFRPTAQKIILVVTDEPSLQKGDGKSNSFYSMEDVRNDLLNAGVSLIAISPDFSNPSANPDVPASDLPKYADMQDLVNQTSGLWIDITSAEFSAILEQIKGILTGTHVIEYTSPNSDPSLNRTILVYVNLSVSVNGNSSNLAEVNIEHS